MGIDKKKKPQEVPVFSSMDQERGSPTRQKNVLATSTPCQRNSVSKVWRHRAPVGKGQSANTGVHGPQAAVRWPTPCWVESQRTV